MIPCLIINVQTLDNFKQGDVIRFVLSDNPLSEIADEDGEPSDGLILRTLTLHCAMEGGGEPDQAGS